MLTPTEIYPYLQQQINLPDKTYPNIINSITLLEKIKTP